MRVLDDLVIPITLSTWLLSHLGSIGLGFYKGFTLSDIDSSYCIPLGLGAFSGMSGNIIQREFEPLNVELNSLKDYSQAFNTGIKGGVKISMINVLEMGVSYFAGAGVRSFVDYFN